MEHGLPCPNFRLACKVHTWRFVSARQLEYLNARLQHAATVGHAGSAGAPAHLQPHPPRPRTTTLSPPSASTSTSASASFHVPASLQHSVPYQQLRLTQRALEQQVRCLLCCALSYRPMLMKGPLFAVVQLASCTEAVDSLRWMVDFGSAGRGAELLESVARGAHPQVHHRH